MRYEDRASAPNQGMFTLGILLKELSVVTTTADFKDPLMTVGQDVTYKLAKIEGFSILLDS